MKLFDTHLLIWLAYEPGRLSTKAKSSFDVDAGQAFFSVVTLWEIAIKNTAPKPRLQADGPDLRRILLESGFEELSITADHTLAVQHLPPIHKDPFDRMLLAQASVERLTFVTADTVIARYPGSVKLVA